jgi:dipeptidyl aminopeptidase/acylaminoacyl peptidase
MDCLALLRRIAVPAAVLAAAGCSLPFISRGHESPSDGAWVCVVEGSRKGPLQYRLDERPPEAALAGLVREVESLHGGYAEQWMPSPRGSRVAFTEQFHDGGWSKTRICVASTDGPPWNIVEIPGVVAALAWSPDETRLACHAPERSVGTLREGLVVVDVATGAQRRYSDLAARWSPQEFRFSPDGTKLAFTTTQPRIAVLDLATGAVADAGLVPDGNTMSLLAWLPDGRFAYRDSSNLVLLARPGEWFSVFPTDFKNEHPTSCRPDGGAVLCTIERDPVVSMYKRWGARVRYADGGAEDLDFVPEFMTSFYGGIVVWLPAPGLAATPVR